jgi:NADPH-dependent 2,4-dienoyl-CoA reductase/sulfur reductase-like enzyme
MLRAPAGEDVPCKNVHVVQVDERIAPAGRSRLEPHPPRESLLEHTLLAAEQIYAMPVAETGSEAAAEVMRTANSHARYYPDAKTLGLKLIFRKSDGLLLDAQALGEDGPAVDKRNSALAMAIQMGATVQDLEEAELCYRNNPSKENAKNR